MKIEFKTVYDENINKATSELMVRECYDKQMKQIKVAEVVMCVACLLLIGLSVVIDRVELIVVPVLASIFYAVLIRRYKKKTLPGALASLNGVGCPYNITFGFYDEYFYEKSENNMAITENSVRYEFLKKIVETPESFLLMTKRSNIFYLPKRDMSYNAVVELSDFFRSRLPYLYKFSEK